MTQYGPYENLIQRGRGIQSMLQGSWQKGHILIVHQISISF